MFQKLNDWSAWNSAMLAKILIGVESPEPTVTKPVHFVPAVITPRVNVSGIGPHQDAYMREKVPFYAEMRDKTLAVSKGQE